jgi:hypothetical protein
MSAAMPAQPQTQSFQSTPAASAPRNVIRTIFKRALACATIALAILGVYYAAHYGSLTLDIARWTQANEFRDGCIDDRDHDLPLSVNCCSELKRTRVPAMTLKRHNETACDDHHVLNFLISATRDDTMSFSEWVSLLSYSAAGIALLIISAMIERRQRRTRPRTPAK